ncbi:hypothetical protein VE02_07552 [Pseudogymnoascus sp. 03VT05]|nr:hypothetical protein VE02_07552 [Pseudogymnoascus sp. 03VT05]
MSESNQQQQQVSNGTENNVQWAATHVAPAPGVVTQVRSETTTYATDGDRFVERHEVLAGPLGEEEGYVEKREGHLGVPSGGVVEEVEDGRDIGLLEPEGKVDAEEAGEDEEGEEEDGEEEEGGEKEIGAVNGDAGGVIGGGDVATAAAAGVGKEDEGEGTKEPEPSKAGTPDQGTTSTKGPAATAVSDETSSKKAEKKAESGPAATVAAEAAGEAPVRAARETDDAKTSTSVPTAAGGEKEGGGAGGKRKAEREHGEGERRGRGRPAKGEGANGGGGKGKEPVEGTRRSTRAKGRSE